MEKIKFNKKLYSEQALKQSVADFSSVASFDVKKDSKYITVIIRNIDSEVAGIIKQEFQNYVLAKTIK